MEKRNLPPILKVEKAKNELRFLVNRLATEYDLPGYELDLMLEGILSEERKQRFSLISEQINLEEVGENGKHTSVIE